MTTQTSTAPKSRVLKTWDLFFPVGMMLLVSVIAIVSLIVVAARQADKVAQEGSSHLADSALMHMQGELAAIAKEVSWWDEAAANLLPEPDPFWVRLYISGYMMPEYGLSGSFVLNDADATILAIADGRVDAEPVSDRYGVELDALVERARTAPASEPLPAVGILRNADDTVELVAVSAFTPQTPDANRQSRPSDAVLIIAQALDDANLARIASDYLLTDLEIADRAATSGLATIALIDPRGVEIGVLAWRPDRPGSALMLKALPATAGAFLLITIFVWVFFRRLQRTRAQLDQGADLMSLNARLEEEMTGRLKVEEDLRAVLEREKELSRLKSRFVAMASHEFRTPLTTIAAASDLMLRYSDRMTETDKIKNLEEIQREVRNMTKLLEDVLLIGQGEADRIQFNPAPLDLARFCSALVEKTESLGEFSHPIRYTPDRDLTPILADEKLLRHILINLLSNATKYSPEGTPVSVRVKREDGRIVFRVRDKGVGIPEGDLEHVFEAFHRAENAADFQGTGLGLTIAKKAVDLHGGTITVESSEDVGTTFMATIPEHLADPSALAKAADDGRKPGEAG